MKTTLCKLSLMSSIALAMLFTSCGKKDTVESLSDEIVTKMHEFGDAMSSVKDKESAEAASKKIDAIGDDLLEITKRLEALEVPTDEEKKALKEKMDKAEKEMEAKMGSSDAKPSDKETMMIMGKTMQNFSKKLKDAEVILKKYGLNT